MLVNVIIHSAHSMEQYVLGTPDLASCRIAADSRTRAYAALVCLILEYSVPVWAHYELKHICNIEKVQRPAS